MSVKVVVDLLDQFTDTRVLSSFHNRMWQFKYSEVNVHLVQHRLLVICITANNGFLHSIMICLVSNVHLTCAVLSSTLKFLLSSNERVWETPGSWFVSRATICSVLSCSKASPWKERVSIDCELDVSLAPSAVFGSPRQRVDPFYHDLSLVEVGIFELPHNLPISLPNMFQEILGRGQGDANNSRM